MAAVKSVGCVICDAPPPSLALRVTGADGATQVFVAPVTTAIVQVN